MELAGYACALATVENYSSAKRALVLVGPGNNGGDAMFGSSCFAFADRLQGGCATSMPLWCRL